MKIVQINCVAGGSTGKIMLNIAETVKKYGNEVYTFSEKKPNIRIENLKAYLLIE